MPRPSPSAAQEVQILAFIRAGGYPHVAAEAAGVSRDTFARWTADRGGRSRRFAAAVRQAHAQARLRAEITVFEKKPLDWLRYGPGRDTADSPGWSAAPRAAVRPATVAPDIPLLALRSVLARLMELLEPFPEARRAVADGLDGPL